MSVLCAMMSLRSQSLSPVATLYAGHVSTSQDKVIQILNIYVLYSCALTTVLLLYICPVRNFHCYTLI